MATDSQRRASAAFHAKRQEAGLRKVTVWLGAEARNRLDELKVSAGSKDKAAEAAILAYAGGSGKAEDNVRPAKDAESRKVAGSQPSPQPGCKPESIDVNDRYAQWAKAQKEGKR